MGAALGCSEPQVEPRMADGLNAACHGLAQGREWAILGPLLPCGSLGEVPRASVSSVGGLGPSLPGSLAGCEGQVGGGGRRVVPSPEFSVLGFA